ncbi:MAG: hypothetical protein DRP45_02360 [Candidatus Zixiibacteriota bacterium]|nr:MAG: hypothetical protein DRP45_02360 [candidate division Zixibacteria bacterium]
MGAKTLITIILLLFVAASAFYLILNEPAATSSDEEQSGNIDSADADTLQTKVVATYFHGTKRCPTCVKLEAYAVEAVQSGFVDELTSGQLEWRVIDYDESGNEHFFTDYELTFQSVIVSDIRAGEEVDWKNLSDVWDLVGDKPAYLQYVRAEIAAVLGAQ